MGNLLRLATAVHYHPDQAMVGIARAVTEDPQARFRRFHFFPFGAFVKTAEWAHAIAEGHFDLDEVAEHIKIWR